MTLYVFGSAKAAPGVTTTVLALAAMWPVDRPVVVAEFDADGGDVAAWYGLATMPGIVSLAAQARQGLSPSTVSAQLQYLSAGRAAHGVGVLVAPPAAEQASAALRTLTVAGAGGRLAALDGTDVLVDVGRLRPDTPAGALTAHAAATVVVLRPDIAQVAHARPRIAAVSPSARCLLVTVGDRPYGAEQIATALGVPVAGVVARDDRGAGVLASRGRRARMLRRTPLMRSAAAVADQLCDVVQRLDKDVRPAEDVRVVPEGDVEAR